MNGEFEDLINQLIDTGWAVLEFAVVVFLLYVVAVVAIAVIRDSSK